MHMFSPRALGHSLLLGMMCLVFAAPANAQTKPAAAHNKKIRPAAAVVQPAQPVAAPPAADNSVQAAHLAHDVPPRSADDDEDVPIDWVVTDGRPRHRPQMLSVDAGIWPDSFSLAAFWAAPVLPRGFIRHVNDSFDLEFGLLVGAMRSDWYWRAASTSWQLMPAFGARWNFFLTHNWITFITFKVAGRIGLAGPSPGWFDVFAGAGATYRIKDRVHLRLELNYPQGAVVGLSFPIGAL